MDVDGDGTTAYDSSSSNHETAANSEAGGVDELGHARASCFADTSTASTDEETTTNYAVEIHGVDELGRATTASCLAASPSASTNKKATTNYAAFEIHGFTCTC